MSARPRIGITCSPLRVHTYYDAYVHAIEQAGGRLQVGKNLIEEEVFDAAWRHSRVLAAVAQVLGDGYRLLAVGSLSPRPGHGPMQSWTHRAGHLVPGDLRLGPSESVQVCNGPERPGYSLLYR